MLHLYPGLIRIVAIEAAAKIGGISTEFIAIAGDYPVILSCLVLNNSFRGLRSIYAVQSDRMRLLGN